MKIFIGGAWPYANGSLHIGHIAALLPGDILARYFRQKGDEVLYVSGSDCHGTPIQVRAGRENTSPENIANRYHEEFSGCFKKLGFSYDIYHRTADRYHEAFAQEFFLKLLENRSIHTRTVEQVYCGNCKQFLPDRFVTGVCPNCRSNARGDQCDSCGKLLDPSELEAKKCGLCGSAPEFKPTEHFYIDLSKYQGTLEEYVEKAQGWRLNAVQLTKRYLNEGLKEKAVTRDLDWGVDVPAEGFEAKKIYVWIEAVLGYLSASRLWCEKNGRDWASFWSGDAVHYYVHGKDNIPFHTVILPSLMIAAGGLHLPDRIISSEYLTLEGRKISTSGNWAVWIPYILERYDPDSVRYFSTINGPEKRDTDFSWREFINSHNGELLGAFGNFVNRSLAFAHKYFEGSVPDGKYNGIIIGTIEKLYKSAGNAIEAGDLKESLEQIFAFVRSQNKYFDDEKPWATIKEDSEKCKSTIYTCIQAIANLSNLLEPFIPFSCAKIRQFLNLQKPSWEHVELAAGTRLDPQEILFERIDKARIEEEAKALQGVL